MQLTLDLLGASPLAEAQSRLRACFGPQRADGRHDPISQLVKSIVSSRTYDAVSAAAYLRLQRRYPAWAALMRAPEADVRAAIGAVTFPEKKAPCLQAALRAIQAQKGALTLDFLADFSSDSALAWLERLHGVGRKIAAAVLNFSALHGYAFVIDTHVLRVAQRLGWVSPRIKTAEKAYPPLMARIPPAWNADDLYEMHWLMKRLGQSICTHAEPDCRICPLRSLCAYARRGLTARPTRRA
jgi:endonuclease-3